METNEIKNLVNGIQKGLNINEVINILYKNDYTIIQTMKFIVNEYNMSLAEAKNIVTQHDDWKIFAKSSEKMQNELIRCANELKIKKDW